MTKRNPFNLTSGLWLLAFILAAGLGMMILNRQAEVVITPTPSSESGDSAARRSHISGVSLPENALEDFIHYATVERIDGTIRNLFIDAESVDFLRRYGAFPDRTTIFIRGFHAERDSDNEILTDENGRYIQAEPFETLHVMQRRPDWRDEDFAGSTRSGGWNFGSFDAVTGERFSENLNNCHFCHNAAGGNDFRYSGVQLARFIASGEVQYFYCNLSGRSAC